MKTLILLLLSSMMCYAQTDVPGDYPYASTEWLSEADLERFGEYELSLMRNEIFARYGYIFKKAELKEHFKEQSWYKPLYADVNKVMEKLTEIERSNIQVIQAREAWLRPVSFKTLKDSPIGLPMNLALSWDGYYQITEISTGSEQGSSAGIVGLLADTSKFYAVVWYTNELALVREDPPRRYFITTYTKKLKEIETACVSLEVGRTVEFGATDCDNTNVVQSAYIYTDLRYESVYKWDEKCPGEELQKTGYEVSGRINPDGTFEVIKKDR